MSVNPFIYTSWNERLEDKRAFFCVYLSLQDLIMYDFECHYREERWQTARYFDFVKDFLIAAQNREDSDDCDPPPCPTTPHTTTTEQYSKGKHLFICGLPVVFVNRFDIGNLA